MVSPPVATPVDANGAKRVDAFTHAISITFLLACLITPPTVRALDGGGGLTLTQVSVICAVAFAVIVWHTTLRSGHVVNPRSIFFGSFVLFTQGQVLLLGFGVAEFGPKVADMREIFSTQELVQASLFSTICMVAFFEGTVLATVRAERRGARRRRNQDTLDQVLRQTGLVVALLTVIPFLYGQFRIMGTAATIGYGALQDPTSSGSPYVTKVLALAGQYFTVALLLIMIGAKKDKVLFTWCQAVFLLYPAWLLLIGERTTSTALILVSVYLRFRYFGRGSKWDIATITPAILALLAIFPTILAARNEGIISPRLLWDSVANAGISQSIIDSVAGIGFSIFPTVQTFRLVPETWPHENGLTYLAAMTGFIPKLGFASEHSQLSERLMQELNMPYGPGFSMPAEAYLNFGLHGSLVALLALGFVLGRFMYAPRDVASEGLVLVVTVMFLALNLTWPRREFLGMVMSAAYVIVPLYFFIRSQYESTERRKESVGNNVRLAKVPYKRSRTRTLPHA